MTEKQMWKYLKRIMGDLWKADRIETKVSTGIPDITFCLDETGWIELKRGATKGWGKSFKLAHPPTNRQVHWIDSRGARTGRVFILVAVEIDQIDHFFLLPWFWVSRLQHMVSPEELLRWSIKAWSGHIDPREMKQALYKKS